MTTQHERLHEKAVFISKKYLRCEAELIGVPQEIDLQKTYLHYEMTSLFNYATKLLGLSESAAYALISIARKSIQVPELKVAIEENKITVSNARRIAPILTASNKVEWLEKAASLSQNKLQVELAKRFPSLPEPTKVMAKSETMGRLEVDLPNAVLEKLKRALEVLSQKKQKHVDEAQALEEMIQEFLLRHDPLEKAKRAVKPTNSVRKLCPDTVAQQKEKRLREVARQMGFLIPRKPLTAHQKYAATLRDQNRCTYRYADGTRCESQRWLQFHHIQEVARGGSNEPQNLRILCSVHHRNLHC